MLSITFTEAEEQDIPALLRLYAQIDEGSPVLSPEQARVVFHKIQSVPNHHIYLAWFQGRIVGTFALLLMDSLTNSIPLGIVEDVVVDRDWRRKGIGKQMMAFAIQRCREQGCYKLALSSHIAREPAHRFYESLDFEKHGFSFVVPI
jgi:GNAT superfamily N-acetyltransferase